MFSAMSYCCGVKARALWSPGIGGNVTGGCVKTTSSGVEADVDGRVGTGLGGHVRRVGRAVRLRVVHGTGTQQHNKFVLLSDQ